MVHHILHEKKINTLIKYLSCSLFFTFSFYLFCGTSYQSFHALHQRVIVSKSFASQQPVLHLHRSYQIDFYQWKSHTILYVLKSHHIYKNFYRQILRVSGLGLMYRTGLVLNFVGPCFCFAFIYWVKTQRCLLF